MLFEFPHIMDSAHLYGRVAKALKTAILLSAVCVTNSSAAERWIRVTTTHFEMYTTNTEKQARAALQVFEHVRYFFLQASQSKSAPDATGAHHRAYSLFTERAYSYLRLNQPKDVRPLAIRAQQYAQRDQQKEQVAQMLRGLDRLDPESASSTAK